MANNDKPQWRKRIRDSDHRVMVASAVNAARDYKDRNPTRHHGPEVAAYHAARAVIDSEYAPPKDLAGNALYKAKWRAKRDSRETPKERAQRLQREAANKAARRAAQQASETEDQRTARLERKRKVDAMSYHARAAAFAAAPETYPLDVLRTGMSGKAKPIMRHEDGTGRVRYRDYHVPDWASRYGRERLSAWKPEQVTGRGEQLAQSIATAVQLAESTRTDLKILKNLNVSEAAYSEQEKAAEKQAKAKAKADRARHTAQLAKRQAEEAQAKVDRAKAAEAKKLRMAALQERLSRIMAGEDPHHTCSVCNKTGRMVPCELWAAGCCSETYHPACVGLPDLQDLTASEKVDHDTVCKPLIMKELYKAMDTSRS